MEQEMMVVEGKLFDLIGVNELLISEMNKQYLPMKINGPEDKEGYKAVHEGIQQYVKARVLVEKHAKQVREKAVKFQKDVIAEEKRVIGLMAPGEEHLRAERKAVDDIQAALKAEEERARAEKLQARVDRLCSFGATFNGTIFTAYGIQVAHKALEACSEEGFEQFIAQISAAKEAEDLRLKAEEEAKKAEEARLAQVAAEQEAERKRLEELTHQQEEEAARIKLEKETVEREKKRLADEEAARIKALEDEKVKAEADKQRAEELEQAKKEAAEKALKYAEEEAAREKAAAEVREQRARQLAERKAARQPDKIKILNVVDLILDPIQTPDVKTDDGKAVALWMMMEIQSLIAAIREKAGEL